MCDLRSVCVCVDWSMCVWLYAGLLVSPLQGLFACTGHMHMHKTPLSWHRNSAVTNNVCVCVYGRKLWGLLTVVKSMLMKHFSWGAGRAESFKQWTETERHTYILHSKNSSVQMPTKTNPTLAHIMLSSVLYNEA